MKDKCIYIAELIEKANETERPSDFKEWKHKDLSELFWSHLCDYSRNPTEHSLKIMEQAFLWAAHDNNGLANSFLHAIKWVTGGNDFYDEAVKHGWEQ